MESSKTRANIVVAGAGWWSQGWHLPLLNSLSTVKIVAIIEPCSQPRSTLVKDMDSTEMLATKYCCSVYDSIDQLIASSAQENVDGIIVATPHATHADIVVKALEAGYHVLCEKPMTTDPAEARFLVEKSRLHTDCIFMVNNTANWRQQSRDIHESIVVHGLIGTVRHVTAFFGVNLGWLFDDPANTGWVEPSGSMVGNGFCWGQLSHTLAWIYKSTNLHPAKVFAFLGHSTKTRADTFCTIGITCECGALISISGNAYVPGDRKVVDNFIVGTKGTLRYSGLAGEFSSKEGNSGRMEWNFFDPNTPPRVIDGFEFENLEKGVGENGGKGPESVHEFINGCRGLPYYNGADATIAMWASLTIDAIYRSAQSGTAESVH